MKFGSWSYQGDSLDLRLMDEQGGDLSTYIVNGEWILLGKFQNQINFFTINNIYN